MSDGEGKGEAQYERALADSGLEDVRPLYRRLLVRLRKRDPDAYEEAVRRYERDLASPAGNASADSDETPPPEILDRWLRYGRWLAGRIAAGRTVAVDETGRGRTVDTGLPSGALLLHLPDEKREKAMVLAVPGEPSEPQAVTRELLCE